MTFSFGFIFLIPRFFEHAIFHPSKFLGDISYSLYLSHPFSLAVAKIVWIMIDRDQSFPSIFLILSIVFCIFVSWLSFVYVEAPITKYLVERFNHFRMGLKRSPQGVEE